MITIPIKRALLSVSDKEGLIDFALALHHLNIEIISTGGTSLLLKQANIPHRSVEDLTGLPPLLEGRIKTLHPKIHGGILGCRDQHADEAITHKIEWIDLVVVNFYPFEAAINQAHLSENEMVEYIDVGGPTMVRAAAKNFAWVGVVTDTNDYDAILNEIKTHKGLSFQTRKQLAGKAFAKTADYDSTIKKFFEREIPEKRDLPADLQIHLEKKCELRYGENPHQKAIAYQLKSNTTGILSAKQIQGKMLSYNNILDAEASLQLSSEFEAPTAVIVKHGTPCGVAAAQSIDEAFEKAYLADAASAFGGIISLNRPCTQKIAEFITHHFFEIVLAPHFSNEALSVLSKKSNLRLLEFPYDNKAPSTWEMRFITGGMLMQEKDLSQLNEDDLKIVTTCTLQDEDKKTMLFAWSVLKHLKSNAILIAKEHRTIGIGTGQVSRIDAVSLAISKAGENIEGSILASDAFFPFRDSIDRIAKTGIRAVIQPGGSIRDNEVIEACNEHQIAMVFTGKRCFRH